MRRKDLVIAVLCTFCLTVTLFIVMPTRSQPPFPYDPWADINDDGKIDMKDIGYVARLFGAYGEPINKTALLYDVNSTLTQLLSKINSLNSTITELQNTVDYLNSTVVYLNETVSILNSTGLGAPDYDSGWQSLSYGQQLYLYHNLNTTELLVYFIGRYDSGYMLMHQYSFGSQWDPNYGTAQHGAWWIASNTTVILYRGQGDLVSNYPWNYVRVLVCRIP